MLACSLEIAMPSRISFLDRHGRWYNLRFLLLNCRSRPTTQLKTVCKDLGITIFECGSIAAIVFPEASKVALDVADRQLKKGIRTITEASKRTHNTVVTGFLFFLADDIDLIKTQKYSNIGAGLPRSLGLARGCCQVTEGSNRSELVQAEGRNIGADQFTAGKPSKTLPPLIGNITDYINPTVSARSIYQLIMERAGCRMPSTLIAACPILLFGALTNL